MMEQVKPIDQKLLDACIHCGLCLPACPTYLATGREVESPRGRIYLLNLWNQGGQELTPRLTEHIDSCLGCLGCQTACPSGVLYEEILNQARPELVKMHSSSLRRGLRYVFAKILPDYKRLLQLGKLLRLWQRFKGDYFFQGLTTLMPLPLLKRLREAADYLPKIPPYQPLPRQSWNVGNKEGKTQLFTGCVMDIFYGPVNHAASRLLKAQAQIVEVPPQTCCGALAFHAGEKDITEKLAKDNIAFFEKTEGPIIVTSAGCGAMLKEYKSLFSSGDEWFERANQFSSRVQDISEFLASHRFPDNIRSRAKKVVSSVAYHAACHLAHAQKVRMAPQELLEQMVEDVNKANSSQMKLIPLMDAEHCCGSAGIYNLLEPELSDLVLEAKMEKLLATEAAAVVTSNPGCLLQLEAGIKKKKMSMEVWHLAQLLDQVYSLKPDVL